MCLVFMRMSSTWHAFGTQPEKRQLQVRSYIIRWGIMGLSKMVCEDMMKRGMREGGRRKICLTGELNIYEHDDVKDFYRIEFECDGHNNVRYDISSLQLS